MFNDLIVKLFIEIEGKSDAGALVVVGVGDGQRLEALGVHMTAEHQGVELSRVIWAAGVLCVRVTAGDAAAVGEHVQKDDATSMVPGEESPGAFLLRPVVPFDIGGGAVEESVLFGGIEVVVQIWMMNLIWVWMQVNLITIWMNYLIILIVVMVLIH